MSDLTVVVIGMACAALGGAVGYWQGIATGTLRTVEKIDRAVRTGQQQARTLDGERRRFGDKYWTER